MSKKKEEVKNTKAKEEEVKAKEKAKKKEEEELEKALQEKKDLEEQLNKTQFLLEKMERQLNEVKEDSKEEKETEITDDFNISKPRKIDRNEMIPVKSNVPNTLIYKNPSTGYQVVWSNKGSVEYIEFGELITMRNTQQGFLTRPLIIIEDVDASKRLGADKLYRDIRNLGDIKEMLSLPLERLQEKIDGLPRPLYNYVRDSAIELVQSGKIENAKTLRNLTSVLRFDFESAFDIYLDNLDKED